MPTGQGSPLFEGQESHRDSASVHALREAGAIIIGKTTTTEFAATHPWHKTQNPHDPKRTPGGSSSGSSAAVGAGMVPAGLGTQVVGSILRPSSFCGAVGFKPSVGAINRSGSHDHFSQSCQGAIGATLGRHLGGAARDRRPRRRRSGLRRACRRRRISQARQARAARRARNRRLERHHRRRAPGVCRGQGASSPRPASSCKDRARRSRHRYGREDDRRRAAADARHQRLGGPLAAQHLRRPRCQQAQRRRPRPAEDRRGDDAGAIRRPAGAARRGARGLCQGSRAATTRS